jgi:hypothetical protein
MKKFILITVFFVLISKLLLAQNDSSFKKADEFIYGSDSSFNQFVLTKKLMTNGGLNLFFAKRINTYLTGSSDLSVNQSYFVVDPTDGRLTIGHSWNTNPSLKGERAKHMLTLGLKTNVKDNLSSIYSGSKKWSGNMGITLKYTITGRGVISYNDTKMKQELRNITDNESNIHQGFAIRNISKLNKNLKEAIAKDNTEINEEIQYGKDSLKWELSYLEKRKDKVS